MSEAALAQRPAAEERWEKAESVLWAFTPDGIVLHNFLCGAFVELNGAEQVIWSHLDGLHSEADIVAKLADAPGLGRSRSAFRQRLVQRVLADLIDGGFVVRRNP